MQGQGHLNRSTDNYTASDVNGKSGKSLILWHEELKNVFSPVCSPTVWIPNTNLYFLQDASAGLVVRFNLRGLFQPDWSCSFHGHFGDHLFYSKGCIYVKCNCSSIFYSLLTGMVTFFPKKLIVEMPVYFCLFTSFFSVIYNH